MRISLLIVSLFLTFASVQAHANNQQLTEKIRVAVIVGDTAITTIDIRDRVNLMLFSAGLDAEQEVVKRLIPQVVRTLIDEELYRQEARDLNISISDTELKNALRSIEVKNKLGEGKLVSFLKDKGVNYHSLESQLKAQLLWNKIIRRRIRTRVSVTDKEVDEKLENIAHRAGMIEYDISEIVLPVDKPEDESDIANLSEELLAEIKKGADFNSIAREFSQGVTAKTGGDKGWVGLDDLPKAIAVAVQDLSEGGVSEPIRTTDSYYLVKLHKKRTLVVPDKKESEIGLRQAFVFFKEKSTEAREGQVAALRGAKEQVTSCDNFTDFAKTIGSKTDPKMVMTQYRSLNDDIRKVLQPLKVGDVSPIIKSEKGLHVFMICEKTEAVATVAEKQKIRDGLFAQKVDLQSKRYLRNLRRNAFIDIRL
jgi:peptidyl-prolyl cis-trans isomerase SurA